MAKVSWLGTIIAMAVKQISEEDDFQQIVDSHELTIIFLFNPYKKDESEFFSHYKQLADATRRASVGFYHGDISNSYEIMEKYDIMNTPYTLMFKNGEKFRETDEFDLEPVMDFISNHWIVARPRRLNTTSIIGIGPVGVGYQFVQVVNQ